MTTDNNHSAELWVTDYETGKDHFMESGDLMTPTAKAYDLVKSGRDAWTRRTAPPAPTAPPENAPKSPASAEGTPEVDALVAQLIKSEPGEPQRGWNADDYHAMNELARRLERERDEARRERTKFEDAWAESTRLHGECLAQLAAQSARLAAVGERTAPVQGFSAGIPWKMHLRAYDAYCKRWGAQQALIEGGCRGGFHAEELDKLIPGWREELSELAHLRAENQRLAAAQPDIERLRALHAKELEIARQQLAQCQAERDKRSN